MHHILKNVILSKAQQILKIQSFDLGKVSLFFARNTMPHLTLFQPDITLQILPRFVDILFQADELYRQYMSDCSNGFCTIATLNCWQDLVSNKHNSDVTLLFHNVIKPVKIKVIEKYRFR